MSIHRLSRQHQESSPRSRNARAVASELTMNPLWIVTFATGLVFGMLAVMMTSG